jgi:hypothetical protein
MREIGSDSLLEIISLFIGLPVPHATAVQGFGPGRRAAGEVRDFSRQVA